MPLGDANNPLTLQKGGSSDPLYVTPAGFSVARETADGQVKAGAGFLHTVLISGTGTITAGLVTIYDSLTETGTVIWSGIVPVGAAPICLVLDVPFTTGLFVGFDGTIANVAVVVTYS
jgi:hypothetical protein